MKKMRRFKTKFKIGVVGCGAIGSALAKAVLKDFKKDAELSYLCDHHKAKAAELARKLHRKISIVSLDALIQKSDIIIEAASAAISADVAKKALRLGKQVLIMSVGGLLRIRNLEKLARQSNGKLWIPSGALAGIDAVLAAREGKIKRAMIFSCKPAESLKGAPYFKNHQFPEEEYRRSDWVRLFKGNAEQAVKYFPQNINVAALLSLASLGAKKTEVEISTRKKYSINSHEIYVEGDFGTLQASTRNLPSPDNPKTSTLAILSVKAALRRIFSPIQIL